jgi:hypothetical protein
VEALAAIDGQELKNLGPGGREMKNAAMEYLEETKRGAVNTQMQAELEGLRAQNAAMADDLAALKAGASAPIENKQAVSFAPAMADDLAALKADQLGKSGAPSTTTERNVQFAPADEFDGMDLGQLREYITSNTGQAPIGALNTKTLRRMARDCRPEKASAA